MTSQEKRGGAEDDLRHLLAITAAALTVCAPDDAAIQFTGRWKHLGWMPVAKILDAANAALAEPSPRLIAPETAPRIED